MNIFPSLIAGNVLTIAQDIAQIEPLCAGFHIDCMDFASVGNVTWGPPTINAIAQQTKKQLWVHLMVNNPIDFIQKMALRPGDIVSIHAEYVPFDELARAFDMLREQGLCPSLAVNPQTPVGTVAVCKDQIDHILLMSVQPGKSGQKFLPQTMERIAELKEILTSWKRSVPLALDGGVTEQNITQLKKLGIQDVAVGSAIFNGDNVIGVMNRLLAST